jgi:hypothetical protein
VTPLDAALGYAARGWPVFPCRPGMKIPATTHGVLDATTDPDRIRAWWTDNPQANIAIATGAPGPDVLDIDVKPDGTGFAAFTGLKRAGLLDGHQVLVRTPSGGLHMYFTGTSQRNGRLPGQFLDLRAAGGYVVAPPGHVDDRAYELLGQENGNGVLDWTAARVLLDPPAAFQQPLKEAAAPSHDSMRPGDDWAAHTSWAQILKQHGWRQIRDLGGGRACWCRPGKTGPFTSATTREDGGLYVFSTSTPFDVEVPYSKFGAYALLEHGGDHSAAAAQLRQEGFGEQPPAITFTQPVPATPDGQEEPPEHTSWHPRDLGPVLNGEESGDPKPVYLLRDDGVALIYRGKINALIGESESGKTWIALLAVVQVIVSCGQVLFLDFEDSPAGITGRLLALGLSRAQLAAQFRYIAPDEPLTTPAALDLSNALADPVPDLIVLDGVNAAMTQLGLKLTDNTDVTDFSQRVLKPLKRTCAAVLTVDHVTKDREGRGNYAIGAQAKRADIDGAAFLIDAAKPFGRGLTGKLRMTVSKDRPGHVRAIAANAKYAGTAVLVSHEDGSISATIETPGTKTAEEKEPFRPTELMERVSRYLESHPEGATGNRVKENVTGKKEWVGYALDRLADEGYVTREPAPRNGQTHKSIRPYRKISELQIPTSSDQFPTGSDQFPGTGERVTERPVPSGSPPYGGTAEELVAHAGSQEPLPGSTGSRATP